MRADSPGIKQKRIGHQIPLCEQLPIGISGVSAQKAFVNRVLDHVNASAGYAKQLLDLAFGEPGNCKHPCRSFEHSSCEMERQGPGNVRRFPGLDKRSRHPVARQYMWTG